MQRYILTGAPGSGKTVLLRQLELEGYGVVEEAATDLIALWQAQGIAEPWNAAGFLEALTELQCQRQVRASRATAEIQFHDRSVICTAALARYLEVPLPPRLLSEIERVKNERMFEPNVLFVQNLGFVAPTEARRISWEESLRFERMHADTYQEHGFELVPIAPGTVAERMAQVKAALGGKAT